MINSCPQLFNKKIPKPIFVSDLRSFACQPNPNQNKQKADLYYIGQLKKISADIDTRTLKNYSVFCSPSIRSRRMPLWIFKCYDILHSLQCWQAIWDSNPHYPASKAGLSANWSNRPFGCVRVESNYLPLPMKQVT